MEAHRGYKKKQHETKPKIKFESLSKLPRERLLQVHAAEMAKGARCDVCPLGGIRAGPVPSIITPNAQLTVLGEAPGFHEREQKEPLVGPTGRIMNEALLAGGVAREDCSLINVLNCTPPEDFQAYEVRLKIQHEQACADADLKGTPRPPEPLTPTECCRPRLKADLEASNSKFILTMGSQALKAIAGHYDVPMGTARKVKAGEVRIASLKKQLGSPITLSDGTIIVATYHPAFAMRPGSKHYMHVIKAHITRAAQIVKRGGIDWKEPPYILNPSVEMIESTLEKIRSSGLPLTIDIETDKGTRPDGEFDPFSCRIRCIGMGVKLDGQELLICVPIRRMDGMEWWNDKSDKKRVIQACMNVLNSNPLVGHNLNFDTQVLLRWGLITKENEQRTTDDTILLHRNTPDCDLPHDLGFVASRYFEVPSWKGMAQEDKYYEKVEDIDLALYNLKDVLTTMRLYEVLSEEIYKYGTSLQYEADKAIAPYVRDMGRLGLFVDEVKRGELSLKMNQEAYSRLLRLKEIVGNPKFNPASPHQIRKYLFIQKKLIPTINTKGKDWEDGEDPSTNTQALTKMVGSQACDKDTKDFINTLLEYRAYMKLKGTYIDKVRVTYPNWKKEFGLDIPMVPEVKGPVWRKYKVKERQELLPDLVRSQWRMLSKAEKKQHIDSTPDGVWEEMVVLPERPAMSRLYITYKQHVVSSARLSSSPNCQNFPKMGKVNMLEMFIAPPGHVLVGADFDQIELRIYAAISGDKLLLEAFAKGLDPHSYNAASLFAKRMGKTIQEAFHHIVTLPESSAIKYGNETINETKKNGKSYGIERVTKDHIKIIKECVEANKSAGEIATALAFPRELSDAILLGYKKGDKEKKKLRGYAKTFAYLECISADSQVLTDRGEVPIQLVQPTDLLWDGESWVSHGGVVARGKKVVITYDGITATPEHQVWLAGYEQTMSLADAKKYGLLLLCTGATRPEKDRVEHEAEVFDILDAGPRHRFTVNGKCVSNCYGGSSDKLFSGMSTARDKGSGTLMFPDLKESDVLEWHEQWHTTHPETKAWQESCERVALLEGYTATPTPPYRKRFFPGGANKPGATFNHLNQCNSISARILTTFGYRTIGQLLHERRPMKAYVRDGEWAEFEIIPKGEAPIWRLKTSTGRETEWSQDHRVRRAGENGYEWVAVKDLRPGDLIAKQAARPLIYGKEMNTEDAYWCGYSIGNGAYSDGAFEIIIGNRWHAPMFDQVDRCVTWAASHGVPAVVVWKKKDETRLDASRSRTCAKDEATHAVVTLPASLRTVGRTIGLTNGDTCYTKLIPAKIWEANLIARKSFLLGYLQADGYSRRLDCDIQAVSINICNRELTRDLQLFCDLLGIEGILSGPHKADRKGHIAWKLTLPGNQVFRAIGLGRKTLERGGVLAPRFEAVRLLERTTKDVEKAYSEAGLSFRSAQVMYSRIKHGGTVALQQLERMGVTPTYGLTEVVSIEDTGRVEPVYTLSVDHPDHSYVAESVISKNSSAAGFANKALVEIGRQIPYGSWSPFTGLYIQVHDQIVVCVPKERAEEAKRIVEKAMNSSIFGVAITATAGISDRLSGQ